MHELPRPLEDILGHFGDDLSAGLGVALVLAVVVLGAGRVLEEGLGVAAVAVAAGAHRGAQLVAVVLVLGGLKEKSVSLTGKTKQIWLWDLRK